MKRVTRMKEAMLFAWGAVMNGCTSGRIHQHQTHCSALNARYTRVSLKGFMNLKTKQCSPVNAAGKSSMFTRITHYSALGVD